MKKPYWIKERHNPQTGIYYVAYDRLSIAEAKKQEKSLYGHNVMLRFDSLESYMKACEEFKAHP